MSAASWRIEQCLKAGSTTALFPLLCGWSIDDLQLLTKELSQYWKEVAFKVDEAWEKEVPKPENFFSPQRAKMLDDARSQTLFKLECSIAEIMSVAEYYLSQRSEGGHERT